MSASGKWNKSTEARLNAVVSCCSGGDGCHVEQAGQSVLCSSVDYHPGCFSWVAFTLPAHISTIQGKALYHYQSGCHVLKMNMRMTKEQF